MQISEERQTFSPVCQGKSQAYFSILARALKICNAKLYSYYIYRPQRSCEGYVFTRICDSVHRGGGVLSQHALQVVSQHALQQGDACSRGGLPLGGACSGGCLLGEVPALGGACSGGPARGGCGDPRKQMATVADGRHPTGMHSCYQRTSEVEQYLYHFIKN